MEMWSFFLFRFLPPLSFFLPRWSVGYLGLLWYGIGLVCDSVGSSYLRMVEWKSFSWCCYGRMMGRYSYGYGTVGLGYWMGR
jgi:hypothetical protein